MDEDNIATAFEPPCLQLGQHTGEGLAGIDRVQNHAFQPGHIADQFEHRRRRNAIVLPHVTIKYASLRSDLWRIGIAAPPVPGIGGDFLLKIRFVVTDIDAPDCGGQAVYGGEVKRNDRLVVLVLVRVPSCR